MKNEFKVTIESAEKVAVTTENQVVQSMKRTANEMNYAIPPSGRPKTLEGKYHNYTARIREDLYEFAKTQVSTDGPYQSVNDYLNQLIAKDMLSKERQ